MDRWFDAFNKWPPANQMLFSVLAMGIGLLLVVLFFMALSYLVYYIAVFVRGWPVKDDPTRPKWVDMIELSQHMNAYRKWQKERQTAETQAYIRKEAAKTAGQPNGVPHAGQNLFERPIPE